MKRRYNDNHCESPLSVPLYKLEARLTLRLKYTDYVAYFYKKNLYVIMA